MKSHNLMLIFFQNFQRACSPQAPAVECFWKSEHPPKFISGYATGYCELGLLVYRTNLIIDLPHFMDPIVIYMSSFQNVINTITRSNSSHYTQRVDSIVAWMGLGIITQHCQQSIAIKNLHCRSDPDQTLVCPLLIYFEALYGYAASMIDYLIGEISGSTCSALKIVEIWDIDDFD